MRWRYLSRPLKEFQVNLPKPVRLPVQEPNHCTWRTGLFPSRLTFVPRQMIFLLTWETFSRWFGSSCRAPWVGENGLSWLSVLLHCISDQGSGYRLCSIVFFYVFLYYCDLDLLDFAGSSQIQIQPDSATSRPSQIQPDSARSSLIDFVLHCFACIHTHDRGFLTADLHGQKQRGEAGGKACGEPARSCRSSWLKTARMKWRKPRVLTFFACWTEASSVKRRRMCSAWCLLVAKARMCEPYGPDLAGKLASAEEDFLDQLDGRLTAAMHSLKSEDAEAAPACLLNDWG